MSRKGVAKSWPFFSTRMRPICSTMKKRPDPSCASVAYTGLWRPSTNLASLNESLSGLVVVGVKGEGVGMGDGERAGLGVLDLVGVALAALFRPAQPVARTRIVSETMERRSRKG